MSKIEVCKTTELAPGTMKRIDLPDRPPLAIYHIDGGFHCTDDTCTHGAASLVDGEIDGTDIVCPWHEGTFDIKTGKPTGAPCTIPLKTYPVTVEGDRVLVSFD